jgi:hypothetical protein
MSTIKEGMEPEEARKVADIVLPDWINDVRISDESNFLSIGEKEIYHRYNFAKPLSEIKDLYDKNLFGFSSETSIIYVEKVTTEEKKGKSLRSTQITQYDFST